MFCLLQAGIGSEEELAQHSSSDGSEDAVRFGVYEIDCHANSFVPGLPLVCLVSAPRSARFISFLFRSRFGACNHSPDSHEPSARHTF
jgi:hypothetical protein